MVKLLPIANTYYCIFSYKKDDRYYFSKMFSLYTFTTFLRTHQPPLYHPTSKPIHVRLSLQSSTPKVIALANNKLSSKTNMRTVVATATSPKKKLTNIVTDIRDIDSGRMVGGSRWSRRRRAPPPQALRWRSPKSAVSFI